MVPEDRLRSDRALTERMRNLYGVRVGHTAINNQLVARGYQARRILRKPLLTDIHRRLCLDWARMWLGECLVPCHLGRWVTFSAVPMSMAIREFADCRRTLPERLPGCQGPSWNGFCPCLGVHSTGLLLDSNVNGVVYRKILWDTLVPLATQHFGESFRFQDDKATPHRSRVVTYYLQQEDITKMDQSEQSPDCNPIERLWDELECALNNMDHPHTTSIYSARPCCISGPISMWNACSVWWAACPGD